MASIVNSTKSYANKFYSDIPELRSSTMNDLEYRDDVDLANMSSVPDITSDQGMLGPELEGAVKEVVKSNLSPIKRATTRTYDWKTKNKSFLSLFKDLKALGIKNNKFFLTIYDRDLIGIDPYDPILPLDMKLKIILECKRNPWYWLREVCRIPMDGKPIAIGGGSMFLIDRNSCASWYLFLNCIDHYASKPRQCGKTQNAIAEIDWAFHFGSMSSNFTFANKDGANNKMNLYRLKCQRDMLPAYMQMRLAVDNEGNFVKEQNNVTSMRNPITMNKIDLLPRANSAEMANANGRGMTSSLQYFDEFDFEAYNTTTLNSSAFAYSTASTNAKANGNVAARLFTSTPGDLDSRDGATAAEFIDHMLKWDDKMFDWPIEKLKKMADDPDAKRNGIIYVEHTWKQLKKTEEWYEKQCKLVSYNKETIMREIDLMRLHGSSLSPFDRDDILYLEAHKKNPIGEVDYSKNAIPIYFFENINRNTPYILSVDPALGLAGDNTAMQLINPYTLATAAEFESPYIPQDQMAVLVEKFMDEYCPRSMIVVENNRGHELINNLRKSKYQYQIWYDSKKLNEVTEKMNKYGASQEAASAYARRAYGITTASNRGEMYSLLESFVKEYKQRLVGPALVRSISSLIRKPPSMRIEAAPGQHDDSVMAYLLGVYVFLHADNLEEFGLYRGMADPETQEILKNKVKLNPMQQLRNIFGSLPQELQNILRDSVYEKDAKSDEIAYAKEIQRAKMNNPYVALTQSEAMLNDEENDFMGTGRIPGIQLPDQMTEDQYASYMSNNMDMNDDLGQQIFDINDYI